MNEQAASASMSGAIYGIDTGIIQTKHVESVTQRASGRFAEKALGPDGLRVYHIQKAYSEWRGLASLTTRSAVKEAVSKAIDLDMR